MQICISQACLIYLPFLRNKRKTPNDRPPLHGRHQNQTSYQAFQEKRSTLIAPLKFPTRIPLGRHFVSFFKNNVDKKSSRTTMERIARPRSFDFFCLFLKMGGTGCTLNIVFFLKILFFLTLFVLLQRCLTCHLAVQA